MIEKTEKKILLVDDEPDIREFMSYNLKKEGYNVYTAQNGIIALELVNKYHPDLVILDIMMPKMDGIEVCKKIRNEKEFENILICFLTARSEDHSQIVGFDAGADDYITKPIKPDIFVKKIDALLRRSDIKDDKKNIFNSGLLEINFDTHDVFVNTEKRILAKKEFELLKLLVSEPGKVFYRDDIYYAIWGHNIIVGDRTIDVHIRKLREKIGDKYITTLKGIGYKFNSI